MKTWMLRAMIAFALPWVGMALQNISPSYACACEGQEPRATFSDWLFLGTGLFIFGGFIIMTIILTVRAWKYRK